MILQIVPSGLLQLLIKYSKHTSVFFVCFNWCQEWDPEKRPDGTDEDFPPEADDPWPFEFWWPPTWVVDLWRDLQCDLRFDLQLTSRLTFNGTSSVTFDLSCDERDLWPQLGPRPIMGIWLTFERSLAIQHWHLPRTPVLTSANHGDLWCQCLTSVGHGDPLRLCGLRWTQVPVSTSVDSFGWCGLWWIQVTSDAGDDLCGPLWPLMPMLTPAVLQWLLLTCDLCLSVTQWPLLVNDLCWSGATHGDLARRLGRWPPMTSAGTLWLLLNSGDHRHAVMTVVDFA